MSPPAVLPMQGVLRRYDWGSATAIPALLGLEPDGRPVAELWFGAHPDDPSPMPDAGRTLEELIAADPEAVLGAATVERFGPRLPFLMKVLAAQRALSIQVHPSRAQAEAGFAAEDAAGVARNAPERNYRDRNHKPELLCALTRFEALCGFRSPEQTLALVRHLRVPELDPVARLLTGPDPLRNAFAHLLSIERPGALVEAVIRASRQAAPVESWRAPLAAAQRLDEQYPGDIGVVLSLLLNHIVLEPGEAFFLGAGNVHAYLAGVGVEVMASSDNVLRCGLTSKHIDIAQVLAVTDFQSLPAIACEVTDSEGRSSYAVPVPDFALDRVTVNAGKPPVAVPSSAPVIVLCASGTVAVGSGPAGGVDGPAIDLGPGRAAFVPAGAPASVTGSGEVFLATVGAPR